MKRPALVRFLSLWPTPLLVLGSAHELYLRNQRDLDGIVSVLVPFWVSALIVVAIGCALSGLSDRGWARTGLWAYHAAGAWFLVYSLLRAAPWGGHLVAWALDQAPSILIMAGVFSAAVAKLSRRDPDEVTAPLAAFALVLVIHEGGQAWSRFSPHVESPPAPAPALGSVASELPNVYHLMLDAFQPDLFDRTLQEGAPPLDGFIYFPRTRAFFGATAPSMASVFTSQKSPPAPHFIETALRRTDSLPQRLRSAGYRTVGYLPPGIYPEHPEGFDAVVWHEATLPPDQAAPLHRRLFGQLWFATLVPSGLIDWMEGKNAFGFTSADMRSLRNQRVSVLTQPVASLLSFERYLEQEERLPQTGRYTLIHLLVPHGPAVLAADCSYRDIRAGTDVLAQSRCATRLLRRFLERLDHLGRLRDSTVLVHSDHGSDGVFVPTGGGDNPALFLIKPRQADGPLIRRDAEATLVDVTPTLLGLLGLPGSPGYQGRALLAR